MTLSRVALLLMLGACDSVFGLEARTAVDAYTPLRPVQHVVATTTTITIPPTTDGNALVAVATIATFGVRADGFTDDAGNTWTRGLDGVNGMGARLEIWYVLGARPITSATISVTRGVAVDLMEWDGLAPPATLVAAEAEQATSSATITSAIETSVRALNIGIAACVGTTPAALQSTDFTESSFLLTTTTPASGGNVAFAVRDAGSQEISWTLPTASPCTAGMIAIPAAVP